MDSTITKRHLGQGHLKALDGVRGLAILLVVCSHLFAANYESGGTFVRFVGTVIGYGFFGVDLFFVLSGFLITGILVDSVGGDGFFSKFYARRILRIFPLYYGVLLVLFLLTPLLHLQWNGMEWLLPAYLQNFRPQQIVTYTPGAGIALNHFWSLAIEEQFYLVWPAVVFLIRDRRKLLLTTILGSVGVLALRLGLLHSGISPTAIHVDTLTRSDSLLLGGAFALLYRTHHWPRVVRLAPWGFFAAVFVILASVYEFKGEFSGLPFSPAMTLWTAGPRYTVLALGSCCLIAWSLRHGSAGSWIFERRWLRFFGKYSYGLYVLHMIALGPLTGTSRRFILHLTHSKLLAVAASALFVFSLSVGAAYLSFQLYEKPFLRLKRFFDYAPVKQETHTGTVLTNSLGQL